MELLFIFIQAHISILLISTTSASIVQSINTNVTDFSCSASSSSCETYLTYRTQSPNFLDLSHISDLFGISRASLMKTNNLPSEDVVLFPDQLVFVRTPCGCTGNRSFANITHDIEPGDSFYLVSIGAFENLTDYHVVEDLNPTLAPTKLKVGQQVIFPMYCKCPTKADLDLGFSFFATYVWQHGDDIFTLSKKMNTSSEAIMAANNYRNLSAAIALPIVIPLSTNLQFPTPLYYNTTPSTKQCTKSYTALLIISSLLGAVLAMILLCFLVITYCKHYPKLLLVRMTSSLETANLLRSKSTSTSDQSSTTLSASIDKVLIGVTEYIDKPVVYETKDIMEATMNLDQRFRLGSSHFRATLHGEVVAVKQAKDHDPVEEVNILRKVNHANLIKLVGVSIETDRYSFLVYEFAENGSLDRWLYGKTSSSISACNLSWKQRLTIALDVANGLQYLHEHTKPSIVHRDIRTGNIILNADFKAKISNFSIAKPASTSITPMTDVYGFGIILLELLSGRIAMAAQEGGEVCMLWKEIRIILEVREKKEERLRQWMDSRLCDSYPIDVALSVATMAKACTSEKISERPTMCEIVFGLSVLSHSSSHEFG